MRPHRPAGGRALVRSGLCVGLLMSTGACSFLFVKAPPTGAEFQEQPFNCTESNLGPVLDAIAAASAATGMVATLSDDPQSVGWTVSQGIVGIGFWTFAAVTGFNKTSRCREAKEAWVERFYGTPDTTGVQPFPASSRTGTGPRGDPHTGPRP